MKTEAEYLATARKYLPEITQEQEQLIKDIANCKKYGAKTTPFWIEEKCYCFLCLRVGIQKLNGKVYEILK